MENEKQIWKQDSLFMTVICFVAYYLGKYSNIWKKGLKVAVILAALHIIIHFAGLSVEIHRTGNLLLKLK